MIASIKLNKRFAYWPAIVWAGIILILSVMPTSSFEKLNWSDILNLDKLGHLIMYAVFTVLLIIGFHLKNQKRFFLKACILAIGFGALMETIQFGFFPGRYFEILDLIANIIGSLMGSAIYYYKIKK